MFDISTYFFKTKVLDKGFVELFDGMFKPPDWKIVNSAKASYHKQVDILEDKDYKLIKYLYEHKHFSTFRHSYYSFRIKAPLFVFKQAWKHQIGCDWNEVGEVASIELPSTSWNEVSGRYTEMEPEFYIPKVFRKQSKNNKQGSEGNIESVLDFLNNRITPQKYLEESCNGIYSAYKDMLKQGICREQARMILPQNIYSECIVTMSLQALLYFFQERMSDTAQFEIREYANAMYNGMKPLLVNIKMDLEK